MKDLLIKYRDILYIIILIIILSLLTKKCSEVNYNDDLSKQNQKALTDKIEVLKNKSNEKEYRISLFETNIKDLKKLNDSLYLEYKKIKKGKVEYISNIEVVYIDTNKLKSNDTYTNLLRDYHQINWVFNDNDSEFNGYTRFKINFLKDGNYSVLSDTSFLTKRLFKLSLTTGIIKEKDGTRRIFVTPSNQNVEVTKIEGAILEEKYYTTKKPVITLGLQFGYGLSFGNNIGLTPFIGIGLQYNFLSLFNKKQKF